MNAVIFSKDRAMQLDCLIRSMYEYCDIFDDVSVLYTTRHYESYELLRLTYPQINWVEEYDFKNDFLRLISDYICLLVDDDIFIRKVDSTKVLEAMDDCDIVSLRLGKNITKKDHFLVKSSVDGNIFKAIDLHRLKHEYFSNPNWLEVRLARHVHDREMCWFDKSSIVGVPNNKVSDISTSYNMGGNVDELDDMFFHNFRIDYNGMNLHGRDVHINTDFLIKEKI